MKTVIFEVISDVARFLLLFFACFILPSYAAFLWTEDFFFGVGVTILCFCVSMYTALRSKFIKKFKNLAPLLCRQRIKIEANVNHLVSPEEIKDYMIKLSEIVEMTLLSEPFAYPAYKDENLVGYGGWIHWVTSGCHVYSYDKEWTKNGYHFITVDCYTCKPFSVEKAVEFTRSYFRTIEVSFEEA